MNNEVTIFDETTCNPCNETWEDEGILGRMMAEMANRNLKEFSFCPTHADLLRNSLSEEGLRWLEESTKLPDFKR